MVNSMPNLHKEARNHEIVHLFDNGRGLTHKEIAAKLGMKESAVSMVIHRAYIKRLYKTALNENCDIGDGEDDMDLNTNNNSKEDK